MKQKTAWSFAWAVWLLSTLGSFAVLEGLALRKRCLPTLSHTLSRWAGLRPVRRRRGSILPYAFASFWLWLTWHVMKYEGDKH